MFKMKESANGKSGYENALEAAARLDGFEKKIPSLKKIEVKVNPADIEFANVSLPEIVKEKGLNVRTIIAQDETIEKGSCIVLANNGVIDANFKTQLAVLQNTFGIYKGGL